jgi:hypothetical protein
MAIFAQRKSIVLAVSCGIAVCVIVLAAVAGTFRYALRPRVWNQRAIRATLETVVPVHDQLSFLYLLENQTDSDYRIGDDGDTQIRARSKSTGRALPNLRGRVFGEFPLILPARTKTHFALLVTAGGDIEPRNAEEVRKKLDVGSFFLFDPVRRYQIEFSAGQ